MEYPVVEVETQDRIPLYGLYSKATSSKTILINIHGTASNFYENYFMVPLTKALMKENISVLSTNNRGSAVMQVYPHAGAALEHFEDCVLDIDSWVKFAVSQGYRQIILQGHSLGAEKVVYYMSKGKNRNKINKIILLGPADTYGYTKKLLGKNKIRLMNEAKTLVKQKRTEQFLTSIWLCHGGVLPKGADSFIDFFEDGSENSKALPFRDGKKLKLYSQIKVPILVIIGDQDEYTVIPIKKALSLMNRENVLSEIHQIKNCNHDFENKEIDLAKIVRGFIK